MLKPMSIDHTTSKNGKTKAGDHETTRHVETNACDYDTFYAGWNQLTFHISNMLQITFVTMIHYKHDENNVLNVKKHTNKDK
jgi:hypothetical protein